jgi:hypothetical protein
MGDLAPLNAGDGIAANYPRHAINGPDSAYDSRLVSASAAPTA